MTSVAALIRNTENIIVLFASPDDIAAEHAALRKSFGEKLDAIKKRLAARGSAELAKAYTSEALDTLAIGQDMLKMIGEFNERTAELDRLAKRSDNRFAIDAPPPPPRRAS